MKVVTSGSAYLDIDAYAGMIAYAELLNLQGTEAIAATTAPLNESISKTVRTWQAELKTDYQPAEGDEYALIDVSDPDYFDTFVNREQVTNVIDHHAGFEDYWQQRIGEGTDIEFIGAACTLVFEHWKAAQKLGDMSSTSARLLICGILDNTLNFGAKVTTDRDHQAYDELLKIADLPANWTEQYFTEVQDAILTDAKAALDKDTKILSAKPHDKPVCIGQLAVWEAQPVLDTHAQAIKAALSAKEPEWFINLISIGERKSYFYSDVPEVQAWLTKLLGLKFEGEVAIADRLWLRKEIIKQDLTAEIA